MGKVSRILFKKAADHRILAMSAELWSESDHIIGFLPNTMRSFRLLTKLDKVSRILFKKAADHKILTMLAELWSEF